MHKIRQKQSIIRVLHRIILFLFCYVGVLFLYYILGNFNGILDSSQNLILLFTAAVSILLVLFCLYGILFSLIFLFAEKRLYYARLILNYLFAAAFAILLLLVSSGVLLLSSGVPNA